MFDSFKNLFKPKMIEFSAVWLDTPIFTNNGKQRRVTNGDKVRLEETFGVDETEFKFSDVESHNGLFATHEIKKIVGLSDSSFITVYLQNLEDEGDIVQVTLKN